jgi:hypothetical protein
VAEEMARQLSMASRRELKEAIGQRYRAAGGWERRQILDEFTRITFNSGTAPTAVHAG